MKGMISNIFMWRFEFNTGRGVTLWPRTVGNAASQTSVQTLDEDQKDLDSSGAALAEWVFSKRRADCTIPYSKSQGTAVHVRVHQQSDRDLWPQLSEAHPLSPQFVMQKLHSQSAENMASNQQSVREKNQTDTQPIHPPAHKYQISRALQSLLDFCQFKGIYSNFCLKICSSYLFSLYDGDENGKSDAVLWFCWFWMYLLISCGLNDRGWTLFLFGAHYTEMSSCKTQEMPQILSVRAAIHTSQ